MEDARLRKVDVCVPPRLASNLLALIGILPLTRVWPISCTLEMLESQVSRHSTSSTKVDSAGVRYLDCRWSRVVRQRQWAEGVDTSPLWTMDLVFVSKRTNCLCVSSCLFQYSTCLSRGCAADLGTSRWRAAKVGCGLRPRAPHRLSKVLAMRFESKSCKAQHCSMLRV